jgi:two-component sensor histidine kinase
MAGMQTIAAPSLARALMNTSQLPLVLFDDALHVVAATPSFCRVFDIAPGATDGRALAELGEGEWNIPQLRVLLQNVLAGGPEMGAYETDLVRSGAPPRRLIVNVQSIVHDDGVDARVLMSVEDVTQSRRSEQLIVALLLEKDTLLAERAVLLQEMQHRVANSLQIIASVMLIKARTVKSEETRLHLRDAHDRVMSVAAVQQHLQASAGEVEIAPYLTKLCDSLGSSMIGGSRPIALEVDADEAMLSSREAVSLGLIVTELVINALKHAFPDGRGGTVTVGYKVEQPGWTLSVTDDGIGRPPISATVKAGLGTSVVEALARQLSARVEITDAGPGARIALVNVEGRHPVDIAHQQRTLPPTATPLHSLTPADIPI